MGQSLWLSMKVVIPLVIFMSLGAVIRWKGWLSEGAVKEMNHVVFRVLLASMVFYNIYQADLAEDFDLRLLIFAAAALFSSFAIAAMAIGKKVKDKTVAPVLIQGVYRSNFVLFGLQVTASICGDGGLGMATVLISVIVPLYNMLAVILFEYYRCKDVDIMKLLGGIVKNPLIIASALGYLAIFLHVHLGTILEDTLKSISQMATPMSLILLGATVTLHGVKKYWKYTILCSVGRLAVIPALFLLLAALLGFRGPGLVALMVMLGSPTAVSSFPMASQMGGDGELAAQIVAMTTVCSIGTIFFWTYLLSRVGFI